MTAPTITRDRVETSRAFESRVGPVPLDELIERARGIVYAGGVSVEDACREALATTEPDQDAVMRLLQAALCLLVGGSLSVDRGVGDDVERIAARFQHRGLHGKARRDMLARMVLMDANGVSKPVIDFTVNDCIRFRDLAGSYVNGWTKRRDAMAMAARLLEESKADRIGSLPEKDLDGVRDAMRVAWAS